MRVAKSFAYYNEFDPYAAQWLRNLIAAGHIAPGVVDERSIEEVSADDLKGFTQCHFFAGIGGWALAARLAGWADDEPLWTGSCPCQPFSAAGKRGGTEDERHLWPVFFRLIAQCRPPAVAGEQVASKLGYQWLAGVRADLESENYAVGAVDLCAASVGAPHIRQRMWWVADAGDIGSHELKESHGAQGALDQQCRDDADRCGLVCNGMADTGRLSDERGGGLGEASTAPREDEAQEIQRERSRFNAGSSGSSFWSGDWINCADGKARRIEPSIEPLAHGIPGRVGRLRAYGNAIVPQVAAEVLKAWRF